MIKVKIKDCLDCGKNGPVTAGRCKNCYWKHRSRIKAASPRGRINAKNDKIRKDTLTEWYNLKLSIRPITCENCGGILSESMAINPRTIICHIVPKRDFPEVETNMLNCWYGCQSCHHKYDNGDAEGLKILPVLRSRFSMFRGLIMSENAHKIPDYLTL